MEIATDLDESGEYNMRELLISQKINEEYPIKVTNRKFMSATLLISISTIDTMLLCTQKGARNFAHKNLPRLLHSTNYYVLRWQQLFKRVRIIMLRDVHVFQIQQNHTFRGTESRYCQQERPRMSIPFTLNEFMCERLLYYAAVWLDHSLALYGHLVSGETNMRHLIQNERVAPLEWESIYGVWRSWKQMTSKNNNSKLVLL